MAKAIIEASTIDFIGSWPLAVVAVVALAAATVGFAVLVGRWIDAQSNSVVTPPRKDKTKRPEDE